jgi:hypothetical protein
VDADDHINFEESDDFLNSFKKKGSSGNCSLDPPPNKKSKKQFNKKLKTDISIAAQLEKKPKSNLETKMETNHIDVNNAEDVNFATKSKGISRPSHTGVNADTLTTCATLAAPHGVSVYEGYLAIISMFS